MYEIIIGRDKKDRDRYKLRGTIPIAKHYVKMGQVSSLANPIMIDSIRSHVIFICGKRGSGKSYTMGSLAEGLGLLEPEIRQNIATIMFDTMGVFWTMKYVNKQDESLMEEWGLKEQNLNVKILVPKGKYDALKGEGLPVDGSFSIPISDMDGNSWCSTFDIDPLSEVGSFIQRVASYSETQNSFSSIYAAIEKLETQEYVRLLVENLFKNAESWGLFSEEGTQIRDLAIGGQITVLDISSYANANSASSIRALVISLISQKLFDDRMDARKLEEYQDVKDSMRYFVGRPEGEQMPVVWLFVDEAHEFLPKKGHTLATQPLLTLLREGRQPGISLVLASQQPGQIHTDVLTQSDVVISHRLTAKIDIDALGLLMQSYMREGLDKEVNNLPRVKGAALIFDDTNERMYPAQIRPRYTWHGGSSPTAIHETENKLF